MLPFRLKPPAYSPALKKKQQQQAEEEKHAGTYVERLPLEGGGPLQVAIEKDLLELRTVFFQQQQQNDEAAALSSSSAAAVVAPHDAEGSVFRAFRSVFASAKIALLHTRLTPPRVDKGQFSQLIYSACLSLIAKAFQTKDESMTSSNENSVDHIHAIFFRNASYGLFCLFALYETNTLPRAPTNDQERLEVCTMGIQADDNTKLHGFRRAFRCPIRVDRYLYTLLLQLRDEALVVQASCQTKRTRACAKRVGEGVSGPTVAAGAGGDITATAANDQHSSERGSWSCQCGVATDTIRILDRLMHHLDYCEYDGPCGAEGLAGHADYPFPCKKPTKQQQDDLSKRLMAKQRGRLLEEDLSAILSDNNMRVGDDGETVAGELDKILSKPLVECLQCYKAELRALRIPSNLTRQKTTRFQVMLAPVLHSMDVGLETNVAKAVGKSFGDVLLPSHVNKMDTQPMTRRQLRSRRRVTWAESDDASSNIDNTGANRKMAPAPNSVVQQDMSYELVLPKEMLAPLQEGIQTALEYILDRDQPIFLPSSDQGEIEVTKTSADEIHDDMSSIGIGGVSLAQSLATGQGGRALKNLLPVSTKSQGRNHDGGDGVLAGGNMVLPIKARPPENEFLAMDEDTFSNDDNYNVGNADYDSETSNLSTSDAEEEDVMSVATSAMGQRALAALLSAVSETKDTGGTRKAKRKPVKRNGKAPTQKKQENSKSLESSRTTEGTSVASSRTGQGKTALDALLGLAEPESMAGIFAGSATEGSTSIVDGSLTKDGHSIAESSVGQGRLAMQSLLAQAEQVKQATTASKKTTTKKPRASRSKAITTQSLSKPDGEYEIDAHSIAESSVGQGKTAMQSLLAQVGRKEQSMGKGSSRGRHTKKKAAPFKKRKTRQVQGKKKEKQVDLSDGSRIDGHSIAESSVGQGEAAMQNLLAEVETGQPKEKNSRRKQSSKRSAPIKKRKTSNRSNQKEEFGDGEIEIDGYSIAEGSAGQGRAATEIADPKQLKKKPGRGKQKNKETDPVKKKRGKRSADRKEDQIGDSDIDGNSAAESSVGHGKSALATLLSHVRKSDNDESSAPPRKKRKPY